MRCNLPKVSKKQYKNIRAAVAEEFDKQSLDMANRLAKLFCAALNTKFGFGYERLNRLLAEVNSYPDLRKQDEVFWSHIDILVIEKIGLGLPRENYEKMDL